MNDDIAPRAAPPRREDYCVVPGSTGPRRDFRITVGLREGWDPEGRVFDVSEAVRTARAWRRRRVAAGRPALVGGDGSIGAQTGSFRPRAGERERRGSEPRAVGRYELLMMAGWFEERASAHAEHLLLCGPGVRQRLGEARDPR